MDLKKYDELRQKIHTKDFEGRNKSLDKWLFTLSFLGNLGSIFFAYFLVFPALDKAISLNLISGGLGAFLATLITILILVSFETIKRILIKNFSFELVKNNNPILGGKILGWFIFSVGVIGLSFYLSLNGAKNFASTSKQKNEIAELNLQTQIDSITNMYNERKNTYVLDNEELRNVTSELRKTLAETPINYVTARRDYQISIDKNVETIRVNQEKIDVLDNELKLEVDKLKDSLESTADKNKKEDFNNIILFILISTSIEILIIVGVYFREFYEYNLYIANQNRLERVYQKRDRYRAMLTYIYKEGKASHGDRIMAASKLVELVEENTTIPDAKKFVDGFLHDMENLDVFIIQGKRRTINAGYQDALNVVNNFDDALRILEKLK